MEEYSTNFRTSNILMIGATGLIGQYILDEIIAARVHFRGQIKVFTSRKTADAKGDELRAKGVDELIVGDLTSTSDIQRAYQGIDTVICALGRQVLDAQIKLIAIAEKTPNVVTFYPSEFGTDVEYGPESKNEIPHQKKLEIRRYIAEHVKRLRHTYIVTGPYAELWIRYVDTSKAAEFDAGGFDCVELMATVSGDDDEKVSLTTMKDVGRFVVASLLHPEESCNRALKVNSFTTCAREVLNELISVSHKEWRIRSLSLSNLKLIEKRAWEQKKPFATSVTLRRIWLEGGTLYERRDNGLIGITQTDNLKDLIKTFYKAETKNIHHGKEK